QRLQRLDMWQYQLQELQEGQLDAPDELERLEGERRRLSHVVELQKQSYQLTQLLHQNDADAPAAVDLLGQAEDILQDMRQYDPRVQGRWTW
ncbi:MAG: DNA repair protein RecN, partial [Coleofasciculaceae cyanobacterium SM2_3_26]|nr:DNA repair protein RecN [Coleofasciculaceae cyanobacterium SM2_3_26]